VVDLPLGMRQISSRQLAFVLVSSALQILCFPIAGPVPVWRSALCWIALAPLLFALTAPDIQGRSLRVLHGAALGYLSGILWYLGNCYWIYATMHTYGGIAKPAAAGILLLFCLYLGLYHALFGTFIAAFNRSIGRQAALILSPFVWVAVELARARITGFPWDLLGIAQVDNPLLTPIAPFTGAYGLSFIIAAVNALWLTRITLKERRHTRTALTAVGVGIVLLYLLFLRHLQTRRYETTSAVATLVQENLEVGAPAAASGAALTHAEMLRSFSALSLFPPTLEACNGIPETPSTRCGTPAADQRGTYTATLAPTNLIVWPEAPNNFFESDPEFRDSLSRLARTAHAPVIAGNIGVTPDRADQRGYLMYNSADFIGADGTIAGRYDKMHLVPFGEYVPYKRLFFFAGSLLQDVGLFDAGKHRTVFASGGHTYGAFICYESVFSDEVREYARSGAEVLVNISDDGWYGDTSAAWEHLNQVRMRAIENHRWVLRATNTGVTAAIDPYGRVTTAIPRHIRSSLRAGFDYEHDITFYAAHGDLFAWVCVVIGAGGVARALLLSRRSTASLR
jgi:apolipoprotein N-acyltransferase